MRIQADWTEDAPAVPLKNAIGIFYNFKYVFPVNEASLLSLRSLEDASVIILINDSYAHSRHVTEFFDIVFLCPVTSIC